MDTNVKWRNLRSRSTLTVLEEDAEAIPRQRARCEALQGPTYRCEVYLPFFSVTCPALRPGLSRARYDSWSMTRS